MDDGRVDGGDGGDGRVVVRYRVCHMWDCM